MDRLFKNLTKYLFEHHPSPVSLPANLTKPVLGIPIRWKIAGVIFLTIFAAFAFLSKCFRPEIPLNQQPVILFTSLLIIAGLVFLYIAELTLHSQSNKKLILWILLTGAIMRGLMAFANPILEVDYHRYFWDGAVTANGFNPYSYSPQQITDGQEENSKIPAALLDLAKNSPETINNINHAYLKTIYPPVTQAAFALAYFIKPWSMVAWRFVLFLFDIVNLLILFSILRHLNLSPLWIGIYWLNPLLVKEIFNSAHMDLLLFPFLLAAIFFSIQKKPFRAVGFLALATAVKIWPVMLLPIFLRQLYPQYGKIFKAGLLFGLLSAIMFLPVLVSGFDANSGFNAYSQRWQLNDSFFKIIWGLSYLGLDVLGLPTWHSQPVARITTAIILGVWTLFVTFQKGTPPSKFFDQCLLIISAIFLLSPTQFPWYTVWMIPLLVIAPRKSLLTLTLMLPVYYLRYYFEALGKVKIFDNFIVWVEFIPVWYLLVREWFSIRQPFLFARGGAPNHER